MKTGPHRPPPPRRVRSEDELRKLAAERRMRSFFGLDHATKLHQLELERNKRRELARQHRRYVRSASSGASGGGEDKLEDVRAKVEAEKAVFLGT